MSDVAPFTFANNVHDRHSEIRDDDGRLAQLWKEPSTRVLVVGDGCLGTAGDGLLWLAPADAPSGELLYLGEVGGVHSFAVVVEEVAENYAPANLRTVGPRLTASAADAEAGLAVHAVGIANWHRGHPRCSRCGAVTLIGQAGHVRRCPSCGAVHFPRTDPAVIMLATDEDDRALLGRQATWPEGRYSTLAGFVEPGESIEDAVRREIHEESGIEIGAVTYAGSQPWPFPSSLMLGFFAKATSFDVRVDGDELEDARWFTRDEVAALTANADVALPANISISRWLIDTWRGAVATPSRRE